MGKKKIHSCQWQQRTAYHILCHLFKKAYALLRNKTVALQVQTRLGEQLPKGAKVHDAIQPWNTTQESDHEIHKNLNLLLAALQQLFMKLSSIISSDAQNLSNSA